MTSHTYQKDNHNIYPGSMSTLKIILAYIYIFVYIALSSTSVGVQGMMSEGTMNCIALHKKGLFAAGDNGTLRQLEVSSNGVKLIDTYPVGVAITSMCFNSSHYKLALGSSKVLISLHVSLYMHIPLRFILL